MKHESISLRAKRAFLVKMAGLCVAGLFAFFAVTIRAADETHVLVWPERATAPQGPWATTPVTDAQVTADGKLLLPVQQDQEYWRLRIAKTDQLGFDLGLPLSQVPPISRRIAEDFLAAHTTPPDMPDEFHEGWERAKLADTVIPVYDAGVNGGRTPAYLEFKVIADEPESAPSQFRTTAGALRPDQGFILVSLTEDDFPVSDWSPEGETPVEILRRRAGTGLIKATRFGGALTVAEDENGHVRASDGTLLFRPSPELLTYANFVGSSSADSETGESNGTPGLRLEGAFQPYSGYEEMKRDYATNEYYQVSRNRLKNETRVHWMIENGRLPEAFVVETGQSITVLEGQEVRSVRLDIPDEEMPIARFMLMGTAGLQIDGVAVGGGVLYVEVGGREDIYLLRVTPPAAEGGAGGGTFTPGWRTYKVYSAGTDTDQRLYSQYQSLLFGGGGEGNFVGCGPCAWTMLLGWWDLQGVPVIFRPRYEGSGLLNWKLGLPDAPGENDYYVRQMMQDFRNQWVDPLYCDVFNGQCGTPPDKMAEGVNYFGSMSFLYNLAYSPLLQENVLGYGYEIKWSWFAQNGVNDFNKLARKSIQSGYPSIIGIGSLSHYVVAYKYIESRYEAAPGYFPFWRAWLKSNWGNGSRKYYKFTDNYFFATRCRFWQKHTEYTAP